MEFVITISIIFTSLLLAGGIFFSKIYKAKQNDIKEKDEIILKLEKQNIQLSIELKKDTQFAREKINFLEEQEQHFNEKWSQLTKQIFNANQDIFETRSKKTVSSLMEPYEKQLKDFKETVDGFNRQNQDLRVELRTQISGLKDLNLQMNEQAESLSKALLGDSKIRGSWGEEKLELILDFYGLQEGLDYTKQASYEDEHGKRKIPDIIINLPGQRKIIVDSKVSLVDYVNFHNSDDNGNKQQALKSHIMSLKRHIKDLSDKDYSQFGSFDHVVMFVPIEPALNIALSQDLNLSKYAIENNVMLTGPNNFMYLTLMFSSILREYRQDQNVLKIAEAGGKIHDQIVLLIEGLKQAQHYFNKTNDSFDKIYNRLISGRGNLMDKADKLKQLGAKVKRKLPDSMETATKKPKENSKPFLENKINN